MRSQQSAQHSAQQRHDVRCTNPRCPSRRHAELGALGCRVEQHADYVTIVWKCRRCKQGQRTPLPKADPDT